MKLNQSDLQVINKVSVGQYDSIDDVQNLNKKQILNMIDRLSELIGYDEAIDDIDELGKRADNVISKLLILLETRGDLKDHDDY